MNGEGFSPSEIGWIAMAAGTAGLLAMLFILLFFTAGEPFGTLNDIFIGITAILSVVLAGALYFQPHLRPPALSLVILVLAVAGALVVVYGSYLVISGSTGWFLAGLYMSLGNALIGLWLMALNLSFQREGPWPHSLAGFGVVTGVVLALGLFSIPGILNRIDAPEAATLLTYLGLANALGYLGLQPVWLVLVGRFLLTR